VSGHATPGQKGRHAIYLSFSEDDCTNY